MLGTCDALMREAVQNLVEEFPRSGRITLVTRKGIIDPG
jgi:hypothetical protein